MLQRIEGRTDISLQRRHEKSSFHISSLPPFRFSSLPFSARELQRPQPPHRKFFTAQWGRRARPESHYPRALGRLPALHLDSRRASLEKISRASHCQPTRRANFSSQLPMKSWGNAEGSHSQTAARLVFDLRVDKLRSDGATSFRVLCADIAAVLSERGNELFLRVEWRHCKV